MKALKNSGSKNFENTLENSCGEGLDQFRKDLLKIFSWYRQMVYCRKVESGYLRLIWGIVCKFCLINF